MVRRSGRFRPTMAEIDGGLGCGGAPMVRGRRECGGGLFFGGFWLKVEEEEDRVMFG
ncbi:hypothetical protein HAX54_045478, partial [Datura stramonium]|nr:hypothetical protein [Datura stramonium]